jgi:DNA-binding response OmpR family regulator
MARARVDFVDLRSAFSLMIVDDDVRTVQRLAQLLRDDGFVVHTAHDLAGARALAARVPFDVALVDVRLPDGDGRRLADEWLRRFPGLHVIFVTIYEELFARSESIARQSSMTKPVDYPALVSRLGALRSGHAHLAAGE